jgi:uncharacterized PurR-regulated membrane protein YhhQ (DUF165 family)
MKWIAFALFAATVPAANWMIGHIGTVCIPNGPCLIPVGFGLLAPSGVLLIGLALVLRDWLHELAGVWWSIAAVMLGAVLSLASPALALASGASFLVAELADLAVYAPLRRSRSLAVMASGLAGAMVDSALFLLIAFGSLETLAGLVLAKIYASATVSVAILVRRKAHKRRPRNESDYQARAEAAERDCRRPGYPRCETPLPQHPPDRRQPSQTGVSS